MRDGRSSSQHRQARSKAWYKNMIGKPCHYCGEASDTRDHLIPVFLGGPTTQANLVPSCRKCNSSRGHELFKCQCEQCSTAEQWFMNRMADWRTTNIEDYDLVLSRMSEGDRVQVLMFLDSKVGV